MKWPVGKKIGGGYVLPLVILAVIGGLAYRNISRLQDTSYLEMRSNEVAIMIELTLSHCRAAETDVRGYVLTGSERYLSTYLDVTGKIKTDIDSLQNLTSGNPDLQRRLADLRPLIDQKMSLLNEQQDVRREKGFEAAAAIVQTDEGQGLMEKIFEILVGMRAAEKQLLDQRRAAVDKAARNTKQTIVFGILFGVIFLGLAGFFITRSITRPVVETVNNLSSSTSEISASVSQLASSTAETSTSVSETSATAEEIKQTAQVAAQKAKYVSDTARQAEQIAKEGRKAVEVTIESMTSIKAQMESIGQSIMKLSEQGQAIGEIIAVVDDIADQTNLLAVNAAIEAAKADEHGKGFAVVAQEIRSLAEQSKQATTRVRTILNDVRKATSEAVLVTEQGNKKVDAGVNQSQKAGESIQALTNSVTEAAQAGMQITASSQQQMAGTDQVAAAMENIKQATSQNAASTKQLESTVRSLVELGHKLKEMVVPV